MKQPVLRIKGYCKDCLFLETNGYYNKCRKEVELDCDDEPYSNPYVKIEDPSKHYCSMFEQNGEKK